jgi:hypothetical protein
MHASKTLALSVPVRWVCERDLALYLGLSERTLQGWRLRNIGPPFRRLNSAIRYDLRAAEQWAAAQPGGGAA